MAFYFLPPNGVVNMDLMSHWTQKRAQFLHLIYNCHGNKCTIKNLMENYLNLCDCLIEGTAVDAISHFTLRLACANDRCSKHIFKFSETALFQYRLSNMNENDFTNFISNFKQMCIYFLEIAAKSNSINQTSEMIEFLSCFVDLNCGDLFEQVHSISTVCVPFRFLPALVAQRKVLINHGKASVFPEYADELFTAVYDEWLEYGLELASAWLPVVLAEDNRLKPILEECQKRLCHMPSLSTFAPVITSQNVDLLAYKFPPCMRHLHKCLRFNHRLRHMSRITYTLFLKDIGLAVGEALEFWGHEYSQPVPLNTSYHGCKHSWTNRFQHFNYSVNHLYGLQGKRGNYQCFTCHFIQSHVWQIHEEGCCPFQHQEALERLVCSCRLSVRNMIVNLCNSKEYSMACRLFLLHEAHACKHQLQSHASDSCCMFQSLEAVDKLELELAPMLTSCVDCNVLQSIGNQSSVTATCSVCRLLPGVKSVDVGMFLQTVDNDICSQLYALPFRTPLDFYRTFNHLLTGLHNCNKQQSESK